VGAPLSVRAPLGHIKGRARPLEHRWTRALEGHRDRPKFSQPSHSRGKAIQHTVDVGYYAPAARTTLNPAVFLVFLREIDLRLATPEYTPSGLGRVPSATRPWFAAPRHLARQVGAF